MAMAAVLAAVVAADTVGSVARRAAAECRLTCRRANAQWSPGA